MRDMKTYTLYWKNEDTNKVSSKDFSNEAGADHSAMEKALELVEGGAKFLDVRLEEEFRNNGIEGSLNIPLFMLRLEVDSLDPKISYVVYCDTERKSSAAAFLLGERGFKTYVIQGGLLKG